MVDNTMDTTKNQLPRDVFLYLLSVVALAMTAVNFGVLLFQYINIYLPDKLVDQAYMITSYFGAIRWSISTLVIVFPVFLWVSNFLRKDVVSHPEKRELKIRKWLLYLTLFVAGMVVIGDLVALVYNYLQGDLTFRFFLKICSISFIAGSIFYYYRNELREEGQKSLTWFARIVTGIVTAAVIIGFVVAGSPQAQRSVRFDQQRVGDLQSLQWQIINYWQRKEKLPETLDLLRDDISGFQVPLDPTTDKSYEYHVNSSTSFTLCGVFEADNVADTNSIPKPAIGSAVPYERGGTWIHGVGRVCFDRTIDPDLYPPVVPKN